MLQSIRTIVWRICEDYDLLFFWHAIAMPLTTVYERNGFDLVTDRHVQPPTPDERLHLGRPGFLCLVLTTSY